MHGVVESLGAGSHTAELQYYTQGGTVRVVAVSSASEAYARLSAKVVPSAELVFGVAKDTQGDEWAFAGQLYFLAVHDMCLTTSGVQELSDRLLSESDVWGSARPGDARLLLGAREAVEADALQLETLIAFCDARDVTQASSSVCPIVNQLVAQVRAKITSQHESGLSKTKHVRRWMRGSWFVLGRSFLVYFGLKLLT